MTDVKIAIIDYGLGNLRSVKRGFERSGGDVIVTSDIDIIFPNDLDIFSLFIVTNPLCIQ